MSYKALKLGSRTQSKESTDSSFRKIDEMLAELYRTTVDLTDYATKNYVSLQVANLVNSAPAALNTLKELADALGSDANFSTTVSTSLGNRLRVDVNTQGLDNTQKSNARTNLGLATVAATGSYTDLTNRPSLIFSYNDLTNKPTLFSGSYTDLTNKPTISDPDRLVNGSHTLILDSDGILTLSAGGSVVSPAFVTTADSAIFQRVNFDTGLNIRSDVAGSPIYIYNYGTDGNGTGSSEIDILNNTVNIYADLGTVDESKWSFKNFDDGNGGKWGGFVTPTMVLGSVNNEDQLGSIIGTNSITLGNTGLKSYIRIEGPDDGSTDNVGVSVPRANTIRIISNNIGNFVNGLGPTSPGRIILEAGGYQNDYAAKIYMGENSNPTHAFPPLSPNPTVTTTNNIEIIGGVAFYGDVTIQAGDTLGIRGQIVFNDGSIQTSAYTGSTINSIVGDPVTLNAKYNEIVVATNAKQTNGTEFWYFFNSLPDVGTTQIQAGWIVNGPGLTNIEVTEANHFEIQSQIFISGFNVYDNPVHFTAGAEYTFTNTVAKSLVLGIDGSVKMPTSSIRNNDLGWVPTTYQLDAAQTTRIFIGGPPQVTSPQVVFTSMNTHVGGIKALIKVFFIDNSVSGTLVYHKQMCEMIISVKATINTAFGLPAVYTAVGSVYGVVHTTDEPLATFTVDVVDNKIKILAESAAGAGQQGTMDIQVVATELLDF
jgi:hypothetical protein